VEGRRDGKAWRIALVLIAVLAAGGSARAGGAGEKPKCGTPPEGTTLVAPDEVFVLAGQSNMSGRGQPWQKGTCNNDPRLLMWVNGGWQVATDPIRGVDRKKGVSPGMTFGLDVLRDRPAETVGLVQCSVGGTSIIDWRPSGSLYQRCVSLALATGRPLGGWLFLQGESEVRNADLARAWKEHFEEMLAAFRAQFGAQVPFLLGQIGNLGNAGAIVREQQAEAAAENPRVALVTTADLPLGSDGQHFTIPSYKIIGERFGVAWCSLAGPPCSASSSGSGSGIVPKITKLKPTKGPVGTTVTFRGKGFAAATAVQFNGSDAASFTVVSDGTIAAVIAPGTTSGRVSVTTPAGSGTGPKFRITATS
jgi:Carbohydrate esterase, sialic acid-specific acetylesterase/IPT/TIG domain